MARTIGLGIQDFKKIVDLERAVLTGITRISKE